MLNEFKFIGNLTKDVQLRKTNSGNSVTNLDIAYNYYVNGEKQTDYAQITVWGKQAEDASKYLTKGRQVYAEGRIVIKKRQIEGKNTPIPEFHADKVLYLGPSTNNTTNNSHNGERQFQPPTHQPQQANGYQGSSNPFAAQNGGYGSQSPFGQSASPFGY